jgi:sporulation protein YlmC with PRC-barrel domain
MSRAIFLACVALLLLGAARPERATLPPPGVDLVHIVSRPMLASTLIGMEVRDASGARAGHIEDLVFDLAHNKVSYVLVALEEESFAVSLFDLRLSIERAYLRLRPQRAGVMPAAAAPDGPSARAWLGSEVLARSGGPLGRLVDVLVDVHEGAVAFVLLALAEKLHPVPLDALRLRADKLQLTTEAAKLEPARSFSPATMDANFENDAFLAAHAAYADRLTVGSGTRSALRPADP